MNAPMHAALKHQDMLKNHAQKAINASIINASLMHKMENMTKNIVMLGLASILLMPMKANAARSISLEYSISQPDYSGIGKANDEKNNQMSQYIPGWKNLPNPGQLAMAEITFRNPIPAEKIKYSYDIWLNALLGFYGGQSRADYDENYNGDYKRVESNETIDVNEIKLGIEAGKTRGNFSYSVCMGLLSDRVSYSKSRITTFSDSTSGKIETAAEGNGTGYFMEASGKCRFYENFSVGLGIGLKRNNVNASGTERFTDYSDSGNNYENSKEIAVGLNRAEARLAVEYKFGEE